MNQRQPTNQTGDNHMDGFSNKSKTQSMKELAAKMGLVYNPPENVGTIDGSHPEAVERIAKVISVADRHPSEYDKMTNWELGNTVRMLMRNDMAHEGIVVSARNRIFKLHKELLEANKKITELRETLRKHGIPFFKGDWFSTDYTTLQSLETWKPQRLHMVGTSLFINHWAKDAHGNPQIAMSSFHLKHEIKENDYVVVPTGRIYYNGNGDFEYVAMDQPIKEGVVIHNSPISPVESSIEVLNAVKWFPQSSK
jgi:hypothetical protein